MGVGVSAEWSADSLLGVEVGVVVLKLQSSKQLLQLGALSILLPCELILLILKQSLEVAILFILILSLRKWRVGVLRTS